MASSRVGAMTRHSGAPALAELLGVAQQGGGGGEAEGDGLARAGLGADQQVAAFGVGFQHGGLDGGGLGITLSGKSPLKSGVGGGEGHMGPVRLRPHTQTRGSRQ
jgi:hypothetical protein